MIKGIKRDTLHVFPDKHARRIHYLQRFLPWLIPTLNRRIQTESVRAGQEAG